MSPRLNVVFCLTNQEVLRVLKGRPWSSQAEPDHRDSQPRGEAHEVSHARNVYLRRASFDYERETNSDKAFLLYASVNLDLRSAKCTMSNSCQPPGRADGQAARRDGPTVRATAETAEANHERKHLETTRLLNKTCASPFILPREVLSFVVQYDVRISD